MKSALFIPMEVEPAKAARIPEEVYDVFNALIVREFSNNRATVFQDEVVKDLETLGFTRMEIFDKNFLDVESAYRAVGWQVTYDKPGYNESYAAKFLFTKGKYE